MNEGKWKKSEEKKYNKRERSLYMYIVYIVTNYELSFMIRQRKLCTFYMYITLYNV